MDFGTGPQCDAKEEEARDEEHGELGSNLLHVVRVHRIHQEGAVDTLRLRSCIFHSSWRYHLYLSLHLWNPSTGALFLALSSIVCGLELSDNYLMKSSSLFGSTFVFQRAISHVVSHCSDCLRAKAQLSGLFDN